MVPKGLKNVLSFKKSPLRNFQIPFHGPKKTPKKNSLFDDERRFAGIDHPTQVSQKSEEKERKNRLTTIYLGVNPKIGGFYPPKMDGENNGKAY